MSKQVYIGQPVGYCGGLFGRDFHGGRIEAIGYDWVVARCDDEQPAFGSGKDWRDSIDEPIKDDGYDGH